eukprot:g39744.t1
MLMMHESDICFLEVTGVKIRGALRELKKQVHNLNRSEDTFMKWSNEAPMWTLTSLRHANLDDKDKLIMSCFRSCKKNLSYACNVTLKDMANNLIFSRLLLQKPMYFVELQEFMDSCWRQLSGWQVLGQRPVLTAANIKLAKFMRCKGFLMKSTRSGRGERFAGGCCFLTVENIKQTFPRRCWGVTVAGRYAAAVHWYAHVAYNGYVCDLARVELLRARKQDDHLWVCDTLPAQPSLTFVPVNFLDIPCIVAPVPNTHTRFYFMELDISDYLPQELKEEIDRREGEEDDKQKEGVAEEEEVQESDEEDDVEEEEEEDMYDDRSEEEEEGNMEDRPVNIHIQSSGSPVGPDEIREEVSPPPTTFHPPPPTVRRVYSSSDGHVHPLRPSDAYKSPVSTPTSPVDLFPLPIEAHRGFSTLNIERVSTLYAREAYHAKPINLEHGVQGMLTHGLSAFFTGHANLMRSENLELATPTIRFQNLEVQSTAPRYPCNRNNPDTRIILHKMSGTIRPGTMTLVLGEPQSGKTSFLKALAGRLPIDDNLSMNGVVTYSNLTPQEVQVSKLVSLVPQTDRHLAMYTVRETLTFADRFLNGEPQNQPLDLQRIAKLRTELVLHLLGLTGCADTVVGDALLRGVSGGERRRVTLGELLVGGQSVFCCDEISSGLDSAATLDVITVLASWTKKFGGSTVAALTQPAPDVVEKFDDLLLLNQGHLIYHGPRRAALSYFQSLGFFCPEDLDPAEFFTAVSSGHGRQFYVSENGLPGRMISTTPRTPADFARCHEAKVEAATQAAEQPTKKDPTGQQLKKTAKLFKTKEAPFALGAKASLRFLLDRQFRLLLRDKEVLYGKLLEASIVGLLLGAVFYNASPTVYKSMLFFSLAIFQRQAWQQISLFIASRPVFRKQEQARFFRTWQYGLTVALASLPVNLTVSLILGVCFYFLSYLTRTAASFFTYYFIIFSFQNAIGGYFTFLASISANATLAQARAGVSVCFFLLFSGNIIAPDLIPVYWTWFFWLNPLAWALRSVLLNEFVGPSDAAVSHSRLTPAERQAYLVKFQIHQGREFIWIGIAVLCFYYVLFYALTTAALFYLRFDGSRWKHIPEPASRREQTQEEKGEIVSTRAVGQLDVQQNPQIETTGQSQETQIHVPEPALASRSPLTLSVLDLGYAVPMPDGSTKHLLKDVTAHFAPGLLTALMGSSGAGKTTLLDVMAGRKTVGTTTGKILVNGAEISKEAFSRCAAYCEQMDLHSAQQTVREAVEFSANLRFRLENNDDQATLVAQRQQLVEDTLRDLGLLPIQHNIVGVLGESGLSSDQRKCLTIAVELVSNPSILFLDEPTTGLDARVARSIVSRLRIVAQQRQITVLCTIHQPSAALFNLFDNMCLLQRPGRVAYCGPIGPDSVTMLDYFAEASGGKAPPPKYNASAYVLTLIGAGISGGASQQAIGGTSGGASPETQSVATSPAVAAEEPDFANIWATSAPYKVIRDKVEVEIHANQNTESKAAEGSKLKTAAAQDMPFLTQLYHCMWKMTLIYWRTTSYTKMRLSLFPVFAVVFGSTFYQLPFNTVAEVDSQFALMYLVLDFLGVFNMMTVLEISTCEREVFYRERSSRLYCELAYSLATLFAELPYIFLSSLVFISIMYFMIGLWPSGWAFGLTFSVYLLYTANCTFIGQWSSALMPNAKAATVLVGAISCIFNLFSGFIMPLPYMHPWSYYITFVMPPRYALGTLISIQIGTCPEDPASRYSGFGCNQVTLSDGRVVTLAQYNTIKYGFSGEHIPFSIGFLFGTAVLTRIFIFLTLKFISHIKR